MRVDDQWCQEALEIVKDAQANVLVTSLNRQYGYDECKQFDIIASCTTGTDHIDNRNIPLICLKGEVEFLSNVHATSEMTWALIMSLVRKVPWAFDDVKQGNWDREAWQGSELRGKTLGIVGYGRVGQQVAKIAEAFGMDVIYNNGIYVPYNLVEDDDYGESLEFVLQNSDIITAHVPLNAETKGMFGYEQFQLMKPTAYFVNTSRGAVVDTQALVFALRNKAIAGSALDVLDGEPETRIYKTLIDNLGNLIITPHIAGNTAESRRKTQLFIAEKIKDFVERGEP